MTLLEERTIALAGLIQAASLVQSLARTGEADPAAAESTMQSILVLDAVNTPSVFGGLAGLTTGLELLGDGILTSARLEQVEVLRYVMVLTQLQKQLWSDIDAREAFGQQVEQLSAVDGDDFVRASSDVYQRFISIMRPQVIVQGEEDFLQQPEIPQQIRAFLLAGIRAAVLWEQKGGSRFKLLWERTRMQNAARKLRARALAH